MSSPNNNNNNNNKRSHVVVGMASLLVVIMVTCSKFSSHDEAPLFSKSSTTASSSLRTRSDPLPRHLIEDAQNFFVRNATNYTEMANNNTDLLWNTTMKTTVGFNGTEGINGTDKTLITFNFTSLGTVTVHEDTWGGKNNNNNVTDAPTDDTVATAIPTSTLTLETVAPSDPLQAAATTVPTDIVTSPTTVLETVISTEASSTVIPTEATTSTVIPTETTTSTMQPTEPSTSTIQPADTASTDAPTTTESPLDNLEQLADIDQVALEFNNTELVTEEETNVFQDQDSNNETQVLEQEEEEEEEAIMEPDVILEGDDDLQDANTNLEDDGVQVDTPALPDEDDDAWMQPEYFNATNSNATFSPTPAPTPMEPFGPITYVGNDGGYFAPYPLGVCQGDCDTDADCAAGLYCHERFGPFDDRTPGCTGGDTLGLSFDVCAYNWTSGIPRSEIDAEPTVEYFDKMQYVGNDGTWYSTYPLGICQGKIRWYFLCTEPVCALKKSNNAPMINIKLGDCDEDADCGEGLLCYQRGSRGFIPGCTGGEDEVSTADFCVWDSSFLNKKDEFMNPAPMPNGTFRLKLYCTSKIFQLIATCASCMRHLANTFLLFI